MNGYFLVAAGGAIGAMGRHAVNGVALRLAGPGFPAGTLFVNVVGSFLMGVLIAVLARHLGASNDLRLFLATGVLGGFTTFSAFSLDTMTLVERGQGTTALFYVAFSVMLAIAALFLGLMLGRSIG